MNKNIVIINQHANNFGDEAAAIALIEELLSKNVNKIDILYVGQGELNYSNIKVNHYSKRIKELKIVEIILRIILSKVGINYRGSNIFDKYLKVIESADIIFVSPAGADIGHYKVWASLLNLYLVKSCNKKIIFHLNTIDDSKSKIFNFFSDRILEYSKIYVREKKSVYYLKEKKIPAKFGVDTAFILKEPENVSRDERNILLVPTKLENWNGEYKETGIDTEIYNKLYYPLCEYALKNNLNIKILKHLPSEQKYIEKVKNTLKQKYPSLEIEVYKDVENALDYQKYIASAKVVVSMRYHGVVLAAKNAIPFIGISYENKMNEVAEYMECGELNLNIMSVNKQKIYEKLDYIFENEKMIVDKLKVQNHKMRKLAQLPVEENV